MGRVTQISGVGWKAQLPFKDFRGSLCPCQPVSELPPTCLDKGIKREEKREVGAVEGEKQLVCRGWVGFLNDLIPVSAERLTVGIPVPPGDNGNSLLLISPPQSHLSTPPPPPPTSLPIFYCVLQQVRGQPEESPFEYDRRGVFSEEQHHSVSCARPGLVIHL